MVYDTTAHGARGRGFPSVPLVVRDRRDVVDYMSISEAALRMPDVPVLLDRCRALATLCAICPDEFGENYLFTSLGGSSRLSIRGECRTVGLHHGSEGTVIWTWDVDGSAYDRGLDHLLEQVPAALTHRLASMASGRSAGEPWWTLSSVMWRSPGADGWTAAALPGEPYAYEDRSLFCLADLIDPSPANLWLPGGFGPEHGSFERADAIRHILALRPLTDDIIRAVNPAKSLQEVSDAVEEIGYRPSADSVPLDRGEGEGAPLVAVGQDDDTSVCRFLLETGDEGFHRLLLHHSGKAVQTVADTVGSGVVQREPNDSTDQQFRVEEYHDGAYRPVKALRATSYGEGSEEYGTPSAFRITARRSGLVVHCPAGEGSPAVLVEPSADAPQLLTARKPYGYGRWVQLPIGAGPRASSYR
ncbi:RICIN domain-containing protein [Streptomyces sp. NPDC093223]|uniref:RICIN domain-containing protein n=1 Tax=Streptomyces sp. NPDC093223 TaxID=3366033 RepID=UPI0037FACA3E